MSCCNGTGSKGAGRLAGGIRGLARAALRTELPARETLEARTRRCFGVPGRVPPCDRLGAGLVCRACGCLAAAKIRVASERCPVGRWEAIPPAVSGGRTASRRLRTAVRPPDG